MPISKIIRLATEADSFSLLEIYGEYIKNTTVTFEVEIPTVFEFSNRMKNISENFPWLVCEIDGENVGYAYASKHRERAAYQWSVDVTVYVNPKFHRNHIATALYTALFGLLNLLGYYNAYAGVSLPNDKSEGFHESFGFKPVGVFHNAGYKHEKWLDVKWFELPILENSQIPGSPKAIKDIINTKEFDDIIDNAARLMVIE